MGWRLLGEIEPGFNPAPFVVIDDVVYAAPQDNSGDILSFSYPDMTPIGTPFVTITADNVYGLTHIGSTLYAVGFRPIVDGGGALWSVTTPGGTVTTIQTYVDVWAGHVRHNPVDGYLYVADGNLATTNHLWQVDASTGARTSMVSYGSSELSRQACTVTPDGAVWYMKVDGTLLRWDGSVTSDAGPWVAFGDPLEQADSSVLVSEDSSFDVYKVTAGMGVARFPQGDASVALGGAYLGLGPTYGTDLAQTDNNLYRLGRAGRHVGKVGRGGPRA